jgi:ABC-type dipeptide/oligopeptide/nickel transport system permease component
LGRSLTDLAIFILKRLLQLIPVLFGIIVLTFFFTHISVTDPCAIWYPHAGQTTLTNCETTFHKPIVGQFTEYITNLAHFNWGASQQGILVWPAIASTFPETLELVLTSLFLMIVIGIPLGVVAAQAAGRWKDHLVRVFYLSGWATPTYLGAVLASIFVAPFLGLPSGGDYTTTPPPFPQPTHMSVLDALLAGNLPWTIDAFAHLIMPAAVLAFINMGIATRMTRSSMLEVLPLDYVKTARMKGLSEFWVLYKHALRNALITTTTVLGVTAGGLLAGTVVVEKVFTWPGMGAYAFDSITAPNFDGTIAVVAVFAVGVVIANLLADLLYGFLDPRVDWR